MRSGESDQDRAGDGTETPRDVQQGEKTCARRMDRGADDYISCCESRAQSDTDEEESDRSRAKAYPRHRGTPDCGDRCAVEDTSAKIASGEPCSEELTDEACGKKASCLRVLDMPVLYERRKKRTQHDGSNAGCQKVKEDGSQHTKGYCVVVAL